MFVSKQVKKEITLNRVKSKNPAIRPELCIYYSLFRHLNKKPVRFGGRAGFLCFVSPPPNQTTYIKYYFPKKVKP